jgi:trans-aconitate 2-methyltransferase
MEAGEDGMAWDPTLYLRFADHRLRPALDLLGRVVAERPRAVYDLGCGPGTTTRLLVERWPEARVVGVDSSEEMLAKARADCPGASYRTADLARWRPAEPADVLYSNAALHWLEDHASLFPRLVGLLAEGGALAVQMPHNDGAPSHTCMREAAEAGPWREVVLRVVHDRRVAEPDVYYDLLRPLVSSIEIWETVYIQPLEGDNPVVDWTRGTALRPLLQAIVDPGQREAFLADYAARIAAAYPRRPDGRTLLPFRRLFIVARR